MISCLKEKGYNVFAIAPRDEYSDKIKAWSNFVPLNSLEGNSKNPLKDIILLIDLRRVIKKNNIDLAFSFTPKGNIYTCYAAMGSNTRCVPTVNGLGSGFEKKGILSRVLIFLYRYSFRYSHSVIFQNVDDAYFFQLKNIVHPSKTKLVNGSGVDLQKFQPKIKSRKSRNVTVFAFVGRLILSKGFKDFLNAAKSLSSNEEYCFKLAGSHDTKRTGMSVKELNEFCKNTGVEYIGFIDSVNEFLKKIDVIVFPSYYPEGLPRILLESLATGLPVITCNTPGCKETVVDGKNGFLVPIRSPESVASAMQRIASLSDKELTAMGLSSRELAENKFGVEQVTQQYLDIANLIQTEKLKAISLS